MTTTAMIVMESGSGWPGHIGDSMNVVAFDRGGDDLLRRAEARLGILHRNKQSVRVAVLACNAATGGPAADQRAQIARTLLGAVTRTTCGLGSRRHARDGGGNAVQIAFADSQGASVAAA